MCGVVYSKNRVVYWFFSLAMKHNNAIPRNHFKKDWWVSIFGCHTHQNRLVPSATFCKKKKKKKKILVSLVLQSCCDFALLCTVAQLYGFFGLYYLLVVNLFALFSWQISRCARLETVCVSARFFFVFFFFALLCVVVCVAFACARAPITIPRKDRI